MKSRYLFILLVFGVFRSTFCWGQEKGDTITKNLKTITQGIYIEGVGRYSGYYSFGYEWEKLFQKNGVGFDIGTTIHPKFNSPSGHRYVNLYLGLSGFYEYGRNWGFRVGISEGITYNPITNTRKLENIAYADWPPTFTQLNTLFLGGFYRTKNLRWQFLLTINGDYILYYHKGFRGSNLFLTPGLIIKYNFKNN